MTNQVVYYPYIRIPQTSWATRVLLYWDQVGSIVPSHYIERPEKLGTYMQGLVREGLVTQLIPGHLLWKLPRFKDAFVNHVDQMPKRVPKGKRPWPLIHMEKLQEIGEELCERGLAWKDTRYKHSPWYEVEPKTAAEFMAYLASVLGQLSERKKFYPITNRRAAFSLFIPERAPRRLPQVREIVLRRILPAPAGVLEPARLADFKSKYQRELLRFRMEVENKVSELAIIKNDKDRNYRLNVVVNNMRESIEELTSRMREQRKWPRINFTNLCALGAGGIQVWQAVRDQDLKAGLTGAALGLAPVVYEALRGSPIPLEDKPLAYASLIDRGLVRE